MVEEAATPYAIRKGRSKEDGATTLQYSSVPNSSMRKLGHESSACFINPARPDRCRTRLIHKKTSTR